MARREWVWKRNCSISPRQLATVYAALCFTSLSIAMYFTLHGAWYILGFSILELTALGLAFLQWGRHASDRERIAILDNCLLVELVQADRKKEFRLDLMRMHVESPGSRRALIGLEAGGTKVEVGRFLNQFKRREFAQELRDSLAPHRLLASGGGEEF